MPVIAQRHINVKKLAQYLRDSIEPLPDKLFGDRYRAAARLLDGTYIPCIVFQSRRSQVELALRRFEELRSQPAQYRMVVGSFVSQGSHIADYNIGSVERSPFAWPISTLGQIKGETVMGWTAFVVEMKDGSMHSYGTSFSFEFFDLPDGYSYSNIERIHSGMLYSEEHGLAPFSAKSGEPCRLYREKPFFTCYLDPL